MKIVKAVFMFSSCFFPAFSLLIRIVAINF
jgi:hypothetical protein